MNSLLSSTAVRSLDQNKPCNQQSNTSEIVYLINSFKWLILFSFTLVPNC